MKSFLRRVSRLVQDPFTLWLEELDKRALMRGYIGSHMTHVTGKETWRYYFERGYSPDRALDEDWSNGY